MCWQLYHPEMQDDEAIISDVIAVFKVLYQQHFAHEPFVNHALPIEIRAFRHTSAWRIFLLLTPWMLARLFMPEQQPKIKLPPGWQARERQTALATVIGPAIPLAILGGQEKAHLNYHPQLGHYLIQPLVQSMTPFNDPQAVFDAWNEVIKTRNQVIENQKKVCRWQQEVSRREFFAKLRQRTSAR
jgi:hypothetical protein